MDASVRDVLTGRLSIVDIHWQVLPFQGNVFQPNMIAMGNPVFLRGGGHPFVSY